MRTKCRRLFQDAARAAAPQCTSGNSQLGNPPPQNDASSRSSVHYMTIDGTCAQDDAGPPGRYAAAGRGAGSGSEYSTVSRDTARVSAT